MTIIVISSLISQHLLWKNFEMYTQNFFQMEALIFSGLIRFAIKFAHKFKMKSAIFQISTVVFYLFNTHLVIFT